MNIPLITLQNGSTIPQVGLGLWKVKEEAVFRTMFDTAVEAGYRHFDTAQAYHNEAMLGHSIRRHGLARENIFITTKIAVQNFGGRRAPRSFEASLKRLQMDYVDLLLLHFPVPLLRSSSWRAVEALHSSGKAKNIGVSNYTISHLEQLQTMARIKPAVNQVELHVFLQQPELLEYCRSQGIAVEAYSPLAHSRNMDDPLIHKIALKYGKSYAQIMLRWCIDRGAIVLPKSTTPTRIFENYDIFDFVLSPEDLATLGSLDKNLRTCWNPTRVP